MDYWVLLKPLFLWIGWEQHSPAAFYMFPWEGCLKQSIIFSVSGFPHPWALHLTSPSLTFWFQWWDSSLLEILFSHQYVCFYSLIPCSHLKFISFLEMFSFVILYGFYKFISSLHSSASSFHCFSLTRLCFLVCSVIFDSKSFIVLGILSVENLQGWIEAT